MAKIEYESADNTIEYGVDEVFVLAGGIVYPWVGVRSIKLPYSSEQQSIYIDGMCVTSDGKPDTITLEINAYDFPEELSDYLGYGSLNDKIKTFTTVDREIDIVFRTTVMRGGSIGHNIHIIYGCALNPQFPEFVSSMNPSAIEFIWSGTSARRTSQHPGFSPSSHVVISSVDAGATRFEGFDALIYGDNYQDPSVPSIDEIAEFAGFWCQIIYNGDGTWTAAGPDRWFKTIDDTTVKLTWPDVQFVNPTTYNISSVTEG